jgi:GYF domain 2
MVAAQRDRWFIGEGLTRRGPVRFDELIRLLLDEADPRAPLVWHRGFASWTRAEDVPRVERRLAPVLARAATTAAAIHRAGIDAPIPGQAAAAGIDDGKPGSAVLVYGGLGVGVVAMSLAGWLLWPRARPAPQPFPLGAPRVDEAPAVVIPRTAKPIASAPVAVPAPGVSSVATRSPAPAAPARPVSVLEDREAELPPAEVRRLRGVAAWSGEALGLTVENRTAWRITELRVRLSRLAGDDLVPDAAPLVLLPPAEPVAPGVADLLDRVAPDRKRPGLNPLDTGSFEAKAGPRPEGFRWEIVSARGYAPS